MQNHDLIDKSKQRLLGTWNNFTCKHAHNLGCISLLLPRLPKLPGLFEWHWLGNLGNLSTNKLTANTKSSHAKFYVNVWWHKRYGPDTKTTAQISKHRLLT